MSKRILSFMLAVMLLVSLIPATVFAETKAVSKDFVNHVDQLDLVPDGYIGIYDQYDLKEIASNPSGLYILMEDIEVSNWIPICQSDNPFTGVLEGNGHTISGIDITTEWEKGEVMYLGLFSNIKGARIADLKVSGQITVTLISASGKISGTIYVGGIAAASSGNIILDNCVSNVTINASGDSMAKYHGYGGMLGFYDGENSTANISYCKNIAEITGIHPNGGIIGGMETYSSKVSIFGCQNEGGVNGNLHTAGIVGEIESNSSEDYITFHACWNKGKIYTIEQGGGICGSSTDEDGVILFEDCLNTGDVGTRNAPADAGGILGAYAGTFRRCVNTGRISGAPTGSAIAGMAYGIECFEDCYWLDTGRSLVGLYRLEGSMLEVLDGEITADAMKKAETFKNFDFESVWEMSEELGHPVPTPILNNIYKEIYVRDTITFADDSYRYKKIMAGSGAGSFAAVVGDTYEQSQLDFWNGVWQGFEFANGFASANVELTNEYDAILADMIYGCLGKDMVASHINDSILSEFSNLATYAAAEYKAADHMFTKNNLKDIAKLGDVYDADTKNLMVKLRNAAVENITMENLGTAFSALGGVITMMDMAEAGCDELDEMYDCYVLCNAYSEAMNSYCKVLTDMADASYGVNEGDNEKGSDLRSAVYNYVGQVEEYMNGDITAIYDKWGHTIEEIAQVGTGTIFDIVVDLSKFNPVIAGIKDGLNVGVPLANALTKMDSTAYYGKMLEMTAFLSKGLYQVVQDRHNTFAHTQTYEDAEALNLAAEMYLNVQILACDYAIGYANSIASAGLSNAFKLNKDDIAATVEILCYKAELLDLKKHGEQLYIGTDGSINGFLANCPVTVTIKEQDGTTLAQLATGEMTAKEGYHSYYQLLGAEKEHKAGFYDSDRHTVTFTGEEDGSMDLVVFGAEEEWITNIYTFKNVPIEKETVYELQDNKLISYNGTVIKADKVETYENPFTDIDGHWGKNYILEAYYDKLFTGMTATEFAPNVSLTRGMFVTVLARYAGYDPSQYTGSAFPDVKETSYYAAPIKWASEHGIVNGLTESSFGPNTKISRQDMAVILYRYAKYAGLKLPVKVENVTFSDQNKISSYAKEAVKELTQAKIFTGNADGTFLPMNSATRAEAATVFCKIVDTFKRTAVREDKEIFK